MSDTTVGSEQLAVAQPGTPVTHEDIVALTRSNDDLAVKLKRNGRERRWSMILAVVIAMILAAALTVGTVLLVETLSAVNGIKAVQKTNSPLVDQSHQILVDIENATNAQAKQANSDALAITVNHLITCVNNHVDHASDPRVALDPACPVASPTTPTTTPPSR